MGSDNLQIFSERLRLFRKQIGKTQKEFVEGLSITPSALSSYEKNNINPSIATVKEIAEKYNLSIDWLVGLTDIESNEREIETYSDVVEMLFEIDEAMSKRNLILDIQTKEIGTGWGISYITFIESRDIEISAEDNFNVFLSEWKRMREMYHTLVIDKDVYELWKEKELKKLDVELCDLSDSTERFYNDRPELFLKDK